MFECQSFERMHSCFLHLLFACGTFSFLFLRIGVNLGNKSLIGGVILAIPTSITIIFKALSYHIFPGENSNLYDISRFYLIQLE